MRYWDSSGVAPLLMLEPSSPAMTATFVEDGAVVTFWTTRVECASAIARKERDRSLSTATADAARFRLRMVHAGWHEIEASESLVQTAMRILRMHPLRAADALQLAAALAACEGAPASLPFVTLDERLADAASREGFPVVQPRGG